MGTDLLQSGYRRERSLQVQDIRKEREYVILGRVAISIQKKKVGE